LSDNGNILGLYMVMPRVGGYLGQVGDELLGGGVVVPGGTDHGQLSAVLNREALPLPEASPPVRTGMLHSSGTR
jgi:hypothetical protein